MKLKKRAKQEPQHHMTERADGFYWRGADGAEHGPFPSLAEAEADLITDGAGADAGYEAGDLHEAESEIGVAGWIDPDSGMPAEDSIPRIEDH
jgi:hypothetical protein